MKNKIFISFIAFLISCGFAKFENHREAVKLRLQTSVFEVDTLYESVVNIPVELTNYSNDTIVVPYIGERELPIGEIYHGIIQNDSIAIASMITTYYNEGRIDTLASGESKKFIVSISHEAKPNRRSPVVLVSFDFYKLAGFRLAPYNERDIEVECIILYLATENEIRAYETEPEFDPHWMPNHPLPF